MQIRGPSKPSEQAAHLKASMNHQRGKGRHPQKAQTFHSRQVTVPMFVVVVEILEYSLKPESEPALVRLVPNPLPNQG